MKDYDLGIGVRAARMKDGTVYNYLKVWYLRTEGLKTGSKRGDILWSKWEYRNISFQKSLRQKDITIKENIGKETLG